VNVFWRISRRFWAVLSQQQLSQQRFRNNPPRNSVMTDLVTGNGDACSHCGSIFILPQGEPSLCYECYDEESKKERAGLPRATSSTTEHEDDDGDGDKYAMA